MSIESAIEQALPHDQRCPGDHSKCICGVNKRRNVLYWRVRTEIDKVTGGKVYLR